MENGEEWDENRGGMRRWESMAKGDILYSRQRALAKGQEIEALNAHWEGNHHVMRVISLYRHGLLLIRTIMQDNLARPASPLQAPVLSLDKRPRSTSPEVATQAATRSTGPKRRKKPKRTPPEFGSPQDVISREVVGLLGSELVARAEADGLDWESPFGFREEVELTVSSISSSGT